MAKPFKTLIRTLVATFYQLYAGYFLLLFYFAFGIMRTGDHIALAHLVAQNTFTVLLMLLFFGIYLLLSYRFVITELKQPYHAFLLDLVLYPVQKQWIWLLSCKLMLNLPVLLYATFVIQYSPATLWYHYILLTAFFMIAVVLPVRRYLIYLNHPSEAAGGSKSHLTRIFDKLRKPVSTWFLLEMINQRPLFFLLAKVISLAILFLFEAWFKSDVYDWRLPALGILIAFSTGLMLVDQYHQFKSEIYWWHQVPVPTLSRLRIDLIVLLLINLLEVIYIVQSYLFTLGAYHTLVLLVFGLSLMMAMNLLHYLFSENSKSMHSYWFLFILAQFILILFKVPLETLIAGLILMVIVNKNKYYPNNPGD